MQPFPIDIPQAALDDLHRRLENARWPSELPGVGWQRGVPVGYLKQLADYWRTTYDWRAAERQLNRFPQFTTQIDGANVHFLHVRSPEPAAPALILTHGWPGSVVEFPDVIGPLNHPGAHGGDPADAFHLVIPSVPSYGFSGPAAETGWDLLRVARAWAELMRRLGYHRYIAQGGTGLAIRERMRAGSALPCQVHDPDLWFADAPCDLERAKALCRGCPAQLACLTGAIGRREPTGVWGGQILDNGEIVTHKRPRGRPRNGSAMPRHWLPQPLAASDRDPLAWP